MEELCGSCSSKSGSRSLNDGGVVPADYAWSGWSDRPYDHAGYGFRTKESYDSINTFFNGLTLRHRNTINAAGGTFMKMRPEECYDLIENMMAHHNDWDTSAQRGESSRSITSSSPEIVTLTQQNAEINKNLLRMSQSNQQVNVVNPCCETCGGTHHYFECQAAGGFTQGDVYAAMGNYNASKIDVVIYTIYII
ncbi:hypothetical protein Tco_1232617 [Tanacetum coccineum]